jgi:signal transduction histidine kinase
MVEDNGTGFEIKTVSQGNGLVNMRERSSLLGGTFSIESTPGAGTTIRAKLPKSTT